MSKVCQLTGKRPVAGNNVSHSNRKTRRRFLPNLQSVSFFSESLKKFVKLRVSTKSIRSIEHNDGIDKFLLKSLIFENIFHFSDGNNFQYFKIYLPDKAFLC